MVAEGYWYPTDPEWFRFLRARGPLSEVNFWRPHARAFRALPAGAGAPFLFKLRRLDAIGGFGYFHRYVELSILQAWDAFETLNGAPSLEEFARLIAVNRGVPPDRLSWDTTVGCIMLASPAFFDDAELVPRAADWKVQGAQAGSTFDLTRGEGARAWEQCRLRAAAYVRLADESAVGAADRASPAGTLYERESRPGQRIFKASLLAAYEGACAVTSEHSLPVLEAAHIRPFAEDGPDKVTNGLLLRADIHKLFDAGLVTVTPDYEFRVSRLLEARWRNGRTYYELQSRLHGRPIRLPARAGERPERDALAWHARERFVA